MSAREICDFKTVTRAQAICFASEASRSEIAHPSRLQTDSNDARHIQPSSHAPGSPPSNPRGPLSPKETHKRAKWPSGYSLVALLILPEVDLLPRHLLPSIHPFVHLMKLRKKTGAVQRIPFGTLSSISTLAIVIVPKNSRAKT